MKGIKFLFWVVLFSLIFTSCKKDEAESSFTEDVIEQEAEIELLLSDLDAFSEEVIEEQLFMLKSANLSTADEEDSCPVITWDSDSDPRKMIIDFGSECEGKDGKVRSGKIIITSSAFEDMMVTRTKTFEDFSVDGRGIDGQITKTITLVRENHSRIAEVNEKVTITIDDKVAVRTGTMTRTHELGKIFDWKDDVVSSWGEVTTEWQDGYTVKKTIPEENPLIFKSLCRQIVSGIVLVTRGEESWSIDYGQGECDNKAIIDHDGILKEIRVGRKKF
jgi:hypothetical protein